MKLESEAKEFIKQHGIDKVRSMGIIYYAHGIVQRCRKCKVIMNKHKENEEQDINIILDKKQYCDSCNFRIDKIWKQNQ